MKMIKENYGHYLTRKMERLKKLFVFFSRKDAIIFSTIVSLMIDY